MNGAARTILIIASDPVDREASRTACARLSLHAIEAGDGAHGIRLAQEQRPDLIVLDLALPDTSALDVCRQLRIEGIPVPIVLLCDRPDELEVVLGLDAGADDHTPRPVEVDALRSRIAAHLGRVGGDEAGALGRKVELPGLAIDLLRRHAHRDGHLVLLTQTEFNLLATLASRAGEVFRSGDLLQQIWAYDSGTVTRVLDTHIHRLRRKLEPELERPTYVRDGPRGRGYRLGGDDRPS